MHIIQWLKSYPRWDTVGWLAVIAVGTVWELCGVKYGRLTTFTDFIRQTVPVWIRSAILGLLVYHFLLDPINYK